MTETIRPSGLRLRHLSVACLVLAAAVLGSVSLGAADLGVGRVFGEVFAQLTGGLSPLSQTDASILWQIRVPRIVLGCLVGAALAVAGAAYQGVFANPLADPYLLGAAAGAGMAATIMIVLAPSSAQWTVPIAAFAGSVGGVALTWVLGRSAGAGTATLLLAGIVVSAFLTAAQTFVQQLDTQTIKQVYIWMLGGLGTAGWPDVVRILPYVLISGVLLCLGSRLLDVLTLGDEEAAALGIHPAAVRFGVLGAACVATAAAVSAAGLIGFVGIIVPHAVRLLVGSSYRILIPLSLVGGAAFLVAADMLARTVLAPAELPIGVVTACVGAPFFLVILRRRSA